MSALPICQAITLTGSRCRRPADLNSQYCWQHRNSKIIQKISNNQQNDKSFFSRLPTTIITKIGQYLELQELILRQPLLSKALPKIIYSYKTCVVLNYDRYEIFEQLRLIVPHLRDITIKTKNKRDEYFNLYDEESKFYDLQPIANFTKLEALDLMFPSNRINGYFEMVNADWVLLNNLKYLKIHTMFDLLYQLLNLIYSLPNLLHLAFGYIISELQPMDDYGALIPNVRTLEFNDHLGYLDFTPFSKTKRLISADSSKEFLHNLIHLPDLEVLEIDDIYGFRQDKGYQIATFPKNIRYLKLQNIEEYKTANLSGLPLNSLEFLGLRWTGDIIYLKNLILILPNLLYLHIESLNLSWNIRTVEVLDLIELLVQKNPDFLLDFNELTNWNLSNWQRLQKLFSYSSLIKIMYQYRKIPKEPEFYYQLEHHLFTPQQWLKTNGYYVRQKCNDTI